MVVVDIASFLDYFESIRGRTLRVARHIPKESMEWRPAPDRWSFGDLLRHLAGAERWMFTENVWQRPSRYPGHQASLAPGWDEVLEYLEVLHRDSRLLLAELTRADLQRKCTTPAGIEITAWKWLRAMAEHEVHHRGQIYLHLADLGIETPPLFSLTEEEVLDLSLD